MEYNHQNGDNEEEERKYLGEWTLIESMKRRNSIEIPSLNLSLNPDGSATSLDKEVKS